MTILECSCGLYRHLLAATVPVQYRTLLEEECDAASYLVRYGDSGHAYTLYLHPLRFICIEVLCWYEVDTWSIVFILHEEYLLFICGGVYHVLNFFMEILLD
jgi:hypothetical protein